MQFINCLVNEIKATPGNCRGAGGKARWSGLWVKSGPFLRCLMSPGQRCLQPSTKGICWPTRMQALLSFPWVLTFFSLHLDTTVTWGPGISPSLGVYTMDSSESITLYNHNSLFSWVCLDVFYSRFKSLLCWGWKGNPCFKFLYRVFTKSQLYVKDDGVSRP